MRTPSDGERTGRRHRNDEAVRVVVRCRPFNEREQALGGHQVVALHPDRGVVEIINPKDENRAKASKTFTYDSVFPPTTTQEQLYEAVVRPLVSSVLEGFNGCIFAYGQTGTGKTYTMEGLSNSPAHHGLIPRTFEQIWEYINSIHNYECLVNVTYLEIYLEEIRDLLKPDASQRLEIREDTTKGFHIPTLHTEACKNVADMLAAMRRGNENRAVGATNMNEHSSRSHAIFTIAIETCRNNAFKLGKLNLVDLAGSERQSKSGAASLRLKEASKINQSLSALGNVISAHAENAPHIPYRDSKLTRLLQDSLGGNSKTIMIANISPSSYNYEETCTTLRYAHRAKCIKNQPVVNEDPADAKLKLYQEEIVRLKEEIAERRRNEKVVKKIKKVIKKRQPNAGPSTSKIDMECMTEADIEDYMENCTIEDIDEQLALERIQIEELSEKLTTLQNRLIRREDVDEQQHVMEQQRIQMEESQKLEQEMKEILEKEERSFSDRREDLSNLQQTAEELSRNVNKAYKTFVELRTSLTEGRDSFGSKRREAEKKHLDNAKQLKLAMLIVDNFVPSIESDWMANNARFNEGTEEWILPPPTIERVSHRPQNQPNLEQPTSEYALQRLEPIRRCPGRYRLDSVSTLALETALRTTCNYKPPSISPTIRAILDDALQNESDLEIDDRKPLATVQSRNQAQMDAIERSLAIRRETQRRNQPKPQGRYFHQASLSTPKKTSQGATPKASKGHSQIYSTHAQGASFRTSAPHQLNKSLSSSPLEEEPPVPVQQPHFELRSSRRLQGHEEQPFDPLRRARPTPADRHVESRSSSFDESHTSTSLSRRAPRDTLPRPTHKSRHPSKKE